MCNLCFRQSKGERPVMNNEASYETKLLLMKCKQFILFNDNRNWEAENRVQVILSSVLQAQAIF